MVAGKHKAPAQVEAVCPVALVARVEMDLVALSGAGIVYQPVNQVARVALTLRVGQGHQVVNVENLAPGQGIEQPKPGHAPDGRLSLQVDQMVAAGLLLAHPCHKAACFEMRAQPNHHRKTGFNIFVLFGQIYFNGCIGGHQSDFLFCIGLWGV